MKYWLINQSEKQLCNLSYEHLSGTSEKMKKTFFLEGCMRCWFTCAFSVSILCLFLFYSELWCFYKTASTQTEQRTVKLYVVFFCFPLCWIPRHSPKVVKAASQVLNSMWQYRDLRSLYKKVKPLYSGYINSESVQLHVKPLQGN